MHNLKCSSDNKTALMWGNIQSLKTTLQKLYCREPMTLFSALLHTHSFLLVSTTIVPICFLSRIQVLFTGVWFPSFIHLIYCQFLCWSTLSILYSFKKKTTKQTLATLHTSALSSTLQTKVVLHNFLADSLRGAWVTLSGCFWIDVI